MSSRNQDVDIFGDCHASLGSQKFGHDLMAEHTHICHLPHLCFLIFIGHQFFLFFFLMHWCFRQYKIDKDLILYWEVYEIERRENSDLAKHYYRYRKNVMQVQKNYLVKSQPECFYTVLQSEESHSVTKSSIFSQIN